MKKATHRVAFTFALLLAAPAAFAASAAAPAASGVEQRLAVEVDKGSLVRLPAAAASVFVANPEVADIQVMSPTLVYVFGRKAGETTLFAVDAQEKVLADRRVTVSHNLSGLTKALGDLLPRANVQVKSVEGGLVLTGSVGSPEQAEDARRLAVRFVADEKDVINRIAIEGPTQVRLRVRVAEVSRTVSKQFGINWESLGNSGNFQYGFARGADIKISDAGTITRNGNLDSLLLRYMTGGVDVNAMVDALAQEGLITVLAEPNLTAMSGQSASFLAGGEFPIPLVDHNGDISVSFKEFGVSLAFTPTLLGESRINLVVKPEVSQLSSAGAVKISSIEIPALTTRRASTTVELGSGQSFAIAGLLQNNSNQGISKFPMLGDLPILGALFRSTQFQRDESELVIIVTPYLVKPSSERLALPTDGHVRPTDPEVVLGGRMTSASSQMPAPAPKAQAGYVVE